MLEAVSKADSEKLRSLPKTTQRCLVQGLRIWLLYGELFI